MNKSNTRSKNNPFSDRVKEKILNEYKNKIPIYVILDIK